MSLRDNLIPYTIEALQILGGSGELYDIREETYKLLKREGKLGYISKTGPNLYQQRKERGPQSCHLYPKA